ncbi:MAG: hypothetical protein [Bacteriophage sp.]|nr:MAG: hypothetical protein [Bacteriophage sp.]
MKDQNDNKTIDAFTVTIASHYQAVKTCHAIISGQRWAGSKTPDAIRGNWRTPKWLFNYLNKHYGPFDIDAAACDKSSHCAEYYSEDKNSLSFDWQPKTKFFLNPPFSKINPWVEKVVTEVKKRRSTVAMIVPDDCSTAWFAECVKHASVAVWLVSDGVKSGRVGFIHPTTGKSVGENNKGTVIFIFKPNRNKIETVYLSKADMENDAKDLLY